MKLAEKRGSVAAMDHDNEAVIKRLLVKSKNNAQLKSHAKR